jgi:NitT/TauT family transport system permease protein
MRAFMPMLNNVAGETTSLFVRKKQPWRLLRLRVETWFALMALLILWQVLASFYPPLILPGPVLTLRTLAGIVGGKSFLTAALVTSKCLGAGILGAIVVGSVIGMLMGYSHRLKAAMESLIYMIQAIPPILLMTLAMIWFGLDGRATVFIVFICSMPVMAVNVKEGFENIDPKLLEMGRMFKFSRRKMLSEIILPSLTAHFKSGLIVVMGLGWKVAVMGEVLCSGSGLGSQISDARINLETDKVFAWGIVVIVLCYLSQKGLAFIFTRRRWNS